MGIIDVVVVFLAVLTVILTIFLVILAWRTHKIKKLNLIPDCVLRPVVSSLSPGDLKLFFSLGVHIHLLGGIIKSPKFRYILTFKNSKEVKFGIQDKHERKILQDKEYGAWNIKGFQLTKEEVENIQYLYLAFECTDREDRDHFSVTKFEYESTAWSPKRIIFRTRRKQRSNEKIMELFKKNPKEWIKKYGEKGKLV